MTVVESAAVAIVAICIRYALGFGFSLIFVPVASNFMSFDDAVTTTIICELGVSAVLVAEHWREIPWLTAMTMKAGALAGIAIGTHLITRVHPAVLISVAMIAVITTAVLLLKTHITMAITRPRAVLAGLLSGILNVIAGLAGPPVVFLYYASTTSESARRAALTGYFLPVYILTAAARLNSGHMPVVVIGRAMPAALTAELALLILRPHLRTPGRYMRPLALVLIMVAASGVLWDKVLKDIHYPFNHAFQTRAYDNNVEVSQSNARPLR
jgi:hypothetical protein